MPTNDDKKIFLKAIKVNDINKVQCMLNRNKRLANISNKYGLTPLLAATYHNHNKIVELLLDAGANPNNKNNDDETPLLWAAEFNYCQIVKLLLAAGADPNKKNNNGWTPLLNAIFQDHYRIIKLLLYADANIYTDKTIAHHFTANTDSLSYIKSMKIKYTNLILDAICKDIADKVLIAMSQQDIIFDTAFIIFKKTVEKSITVEGFNIDDTDTHKKLYSIFQSKFFKSVKN
jgi:ankyrin repeat protein